jgi:hypothetical protein
LAEERFPTPILYAKRQCSKSDTVLRIKLFYGGTVLRHCVTSLESAKSVIIG